MVTVNVTEDPKATLLELTSALKPISWAATGLAQ